MFHEVRTISLSVPTLEFEHVLTRMIMYRLRETGHMDPVLNGQLMGKTKNGSTNGSTICQIESYTCKSLYLND